MISNIIHHNGYAATPDRQTIPGATEPNAGTSEVPSRNRKRRFTKLKALDLASLPGATAAGAKTLERDVASILFKVPVSAFVGISSESDEVFSFATDLSRHGQTLQLGEVTNINFGDGFGEVVLKLDADVDPDNYGAVAADAFARLGEVLNAAPALKLTRTGRRATWRAKVNGTTIAEGNF
ncbi:hypothetical protein BZM26_12755 [Paraburkholderia strydomiana]|nr:hypothetical protein BZM26_12755 [Paraburkholderia strydomiana]